MEVVNQSVTLLVNLTENHLCDLNNDSDDKSTEKFHYILKVNNETYMPCGDVPNWELIRVKFYFQKSQTEESYSGL